MKKDRLIIFGNLPPAPSHAAEWIALMIPQLMQNYDVTCVISDTAPEPVHMKSIQSAKPKDQASNLIILRQSVFFETIDTYDQAKALYVLSNDFECHYALSLLEQLPGTIVLTSPSINNAVIGFWKMHNHWPQKYFHYINETYPSEGDAISFAAETHGRQSQEILKDLSLIDIIDLKKHQLYCPDETGAAELSIQLGQQVNIWPVGGSLTPNNSPSLNTFVKSPIKIAFRGNDVQSQIIQRAMSDCTRCGIDVTLIPLHLGSETLLDIIEKADLVVDLSDCDDQFTSIVLILAGTAGIFCITRGDRHYKNHNAQNTFELPLGFGAMYLATVIAAYVNNPKAFQDYSQTAIENTVGSLPDRFTLPQDSPSVGTFKEKLLKLTPQNHLWRKLPTKTDSLAYLHASKIAPKATNKTVLVGPCPHKKILHHLYPQLDVTSCLKFATKLIPNLLCSLTALDDNTALNLWGYESLIIADQDSDKYMTMETLRTLLRRDLAVITFPNSNHQYSGLSIPINFFLPKKNRRRQVTSAFIFDPEIGLYWTRNEAYGTLDAFLFTGTNQPCTLNISDDKLLLVIRGETGIVHARSSEMTLLETSGNGILRFSLSLYDEETLLPVPPQDTLKRLNAAQIYLSWA